MSYCPYTPHKGRVVRVVLPDSEDLVVGIFEDVGDSAFNIRDWKILKKDGSEEDGLKREPVTINKRTGYIRILPDE